MKYSGEPQCPAPDASDDGRKSIAIGEVLPNGRDVLDVLTQLLLNSEKQQNQIEELTRGMEYLAQQVKTLVDALAEDADPDQPITNYLSGKPI